jgi:hypothetical protein
VLRLGETQSCGRLVKLILQILMPNLRENRALGNIVSWTYVSTPSVCAHDLFNSRHISCGLE